MRGILRKDEITRGRYRVSTVFAGLVLFLALTILTSLSTGAATVSWAQIVSILADEIGVSLPWAFEPYQRGIVVAIRLPRILLDVLVGAALAVTGAAMQGLFRNPLADPGLVGVSSGAALGAVTMIVLGSTWLVSLPTMFGIFALPFAAFVGGLLSTIIVYRLASHHGRTVVATMLLAGIAFNALSGSVIGLLTFVATDEQLRNITFWSLGSTGGATWSNIAVIVPFIVIPVVWLTAYARSLNAFLMGETEAGHMGVSVDSLKRGVVVLTAMAVGASVSLTGAIGFVGLVVPHVLRLMIGPDHRKLIPGSALLGAGLLTGADLISRIIVAPAELPIGIVTAILGAPFFLYLLLRQLRTERT